jgi:hypothetical protein
VLVLVAEGLLNKQIADRLDIQERTVKAHLTAIFERLGVRNRTQAGVVLRELELTDPARQLYGSPAGCLAVRVGTDRIGSPAADGKTSASTTRRSSSSARSSGAIRQIACSGSSSPARQPPPAR